MATTSVEARSTTRNGGISTKSLHGAFPRHQRIQQRRGFGAETLRVRLDAAQGRFAKTAQHVVIVHPHDGDFIGHFDFMFAAGIEHLLSANVIAGKQSQRMRLISEPHRNRFFAAQPAPLDCLNVGRLTEGRRRRKDADFMAYPGQVIHKSRHAAIREWNVLVTAKGEMPEASLQEKVSHQAGHLARVGIKCGDSLETSVTQTSTTGCRNRSKALAVRRSSMRAIIPWPFQRLSQSGTPLCNSRSSVKQDQGPCR
jgi:hypothetical protein